MDCPVPGCIGTVIVYGPEAGCAVCRRAVPTSFLVRTLDEHAEALGRAEKKIVRLYQRGADVTESWRHDRKLLSYAIDLMEVDGEQIADLRALAKRMRDLLGWQCPPGQEDELDAIDAELVALKLRDLKPYDPRPAPPALVFRPRPAVGEDRCCSCVICHRPRREDDGVERGDPVEWLVRMRLRDQTIWQGLHTACWERNLRPTTREAGEVGEAGEAGEAGDIAPHGYVEQESTYLAEPGEKGTVP